MEYFLMKPQAKKIFFYFGVALLGLVVVFLVVRIMLNLGSIATTLAAVLGALRPILLGCILAYLLYPLARFSEQFCSTIRCGRKRPGLCPPCLPPWYYCYSSSC